MYRHCDDGDTPLDELLKGHAAVNLPFSADNELCQLITVSRRRIWSDIKRAFSKPYTNLNLPVRIIFSGEEAVDDGGPRREFFRLAVGAATSDPSLFSPPPSVLVKNTSALVNKEFLYVGKLIAMSIVQGGPGPASFSQWVYDYLTRGLDGVQVSVNDIPDATIRDKLNQVSF